jgi:predicted extracellular nuclease
VPLSIATYNLLDFFEPLAGDELGTANFQKKVDFLARKIGSLDVDVIGLQEVGSEDALRMLTERIGGAPYARIVGTPDQRGIRNAVLSRRPIASADVHTAAALPFPVFVDGDPQPFGDRLPLRRGIVHVELAGGIHVFVVHFKSGRPAPLKTPGGDPIEPVTSYAAMEGVLRAVVLRSAEALFVRRLVDHVFEREPEARVAVVGDFNDVYSSVVFRTLRGIGPSELFDATRAIPFENRHTIRHYGVARSIDHVLVSAPLRDRIEAAHVYNEDLRDLDTLRAEGQRFFEDSDHAPVVVRFAGD